MKNVIIDVVEKDLCCSCGVCAGLCPTNAISMKIKENGDLSANIDIERCLDKCRLCFDVCPFSKGVFNPRPESDRIFSAYNNSKMIFNKNIGWYIRSLVGFRYAESLRQASASGGLATWCLEKLLTNGLVTRIAVVRFLAKTDGPYFDFFSTSNIDELRRASGSVYYPVSFSEVIKEISSIKEEPWAVVGVPCLCSAVRNVRSLKQRILYIFGLACGMYQNTFYTELLLDKSGVNRLNVTDIKYRLKSDVGSASDYRFQGTDNHHHKGKDIPYLGLPFFLGKNAYFRQNSCNYCMDVFAETADACFMDAWLPEYSKDPKGTSLVVIRNSQIDELLKKGFKNGEIWLKEIKPEQVIKSQRGHVRRKQELINIRLNESNTNNKSVNSATLIEKIDWWLQKRTQIRSKRAWANYGRKYGRFAFWLSMGDIVVIQIVLFNIFQRMISLAKRIIRKVARSIMTAM